EQVVVEMLQVRPRRADDPVGARRRDDAIRAADEQRVIECLAQPAKRLADRRLAHVELARRAAHAQLVVERNRDGQQVQVWTLLSHDNLPRCVARYIGVASRLSTVDWRLSTISFPDRRSRLQADAQSPAPACA